jgi:AraC family transcriptional regulator
VKTGLKDILKIQQLVGDISGDDLKYVDYFISDYLGIFIPSVGFCKYAIKPQHTHFAYSFILFFSKEQSIVPVQIEVPQDYFLITALSPGVVHEEKVTGTFKRYMAIFISKELYETQYQFCGKQIPDKYVWEQFTVKHEIMLYLKKFMSEYDQKMVGYEQILDALSVIITQQLVRGVQKIDTGANLITKGFKMDKVIEYMHRYFGKKLTINILAKIVKMSESNFIRVFKKETGKTPREYLMEIRLDKANKLLRSGSKSITEISLQCGFGSTPHFSACYAKHFGITPSEYQKIYLEQ